MNYYYNPYLYSFPGSMASNVPRAGLFSRLFGGSGLTFSSLVSGTQKTLGTINQIIPIVKQAKPIVNNAKTMFKVMNEFKRTDTRSSKPHHNNNYNYSNYNNTNNTSRNTFTSKNTNKLENNSSSHNYQDGPTFFI
jgi:hypothetical protein